MMILPLFALFVHSAVGDKLAEGHSHPPVAAGVSRHPVHPLSGVYSGPPSGATALGDDELPPPVSSGHVRAPVRDDDLPLPVSRGPVRPVLGDDLPLHVSTGPIVQPIVQSGGINRHGAPPDIESFASHRKVMDTAVACGKTYMDVVITFSEDFNGLIYPYMKYDHCLLWHGPRSKEVKMTLQHGICGAEDQMITVAKPGGIKTSLIDPMIEHHLMIQWDRDMVGEDDMNVIVRCERPSDYNQTVAWSVTAKDKVATETRAEHPGPQMYMEMQIGEGPGAPAMDPSNGVLVGETMTILLVLSDEVFWFDSNILDCVAVDGSDNRPQIMWADRSSGSHAPNFGQMQVIENGCSVKKNVFSDFYKEKQTLNNGQMVTTHYAHFKAFRFPTSHKIIVQCNVQVCYEDCPDLDPCSESFHPRVAAARRKRRDAQHAATKDNEMDRVQLYKTVEVFLPDEGALQQIHLGSVPPAAQFQREECYSASSFLSTTLILGFLVLLLTAILAFTCMKMVVVNRPSFFSPNKMAH